MTSIAYPTTQSLAQDIAVTLQAGPGRSAETVRRITDLFVRDHDRFASEHVAVFDDVLGLLVNRIEEHARAELAERLADLPQAPPRVLRTLAQDEIAVARPILARSPQLGDADLIEIALQRGNDHMMAISGRRNLGAAVTDVLVERGEGNVLHAVSANRTAAFSDFGFRTLVTRSRDDDALQWLIGSRPDIPLDHLRELVRQAKDVVRERLQATMDRRAVGAIEAALDSGARKATLDTARAMAEAPTPADGDAARRFEAGELDEQAVLAYAQASRVGEATSALSLLARLPIRLAERVFTEMQDDLLLIVTKSLSFNWNTVAALQTMKAKMANRPANLARVQMHYDSLSAQTAQRVVRFLHARDVLSAERRDGPAAPAAMPAETAADRVFL
jgi:uncharacterized protein (DUF2336 family)